MTGPTPFPTPPTLGVHLTPTPEESDAVEAWHAALVARGATTCGLPDLLGDLGRTGRRARLPLPSVHRAWTWDAVDRRDPRWSPQGVTVSADADPSGLVHGRRLVLVAWYAKALPGDAPGGQGVRVSFFDVERRRYEHVLLVVPRLGDPDGTAVSAPPLRVHAGGLLWAGGWLHVAATARGFASCRLEDLVRLPDGDPLAEHHGYRWVLPVRQTHRGGADEGVEPLRYSFFSLDRAGTPPALVVGEYGRGSRTRRLARFDLDPDTMLPRLDDDGRARPLLARGVRGMQGVVLADGRHVATASRGPWRPGSVWSGEPGALREHRRATPMGPEDLALDPSTGTLWSATEHPRRRWIYTMDAARFVR